MLVSWVGGRQVIIPRLVVKEVDVTLVRSEFFFLGLTPSLNMEFVLKRPCSTKLTHIRVPALQWTLRSVMGINEL